MKDKAAAADRSAEAQQQAADQVYVFIQKHKYKLISCLAVAALILFWWVGSVLSLFNPVFVPSIRSVRDAFLQVLRDGYKGHSLLYHIGASMKRLFIAVILAFFIAAALGLLCGMNRTVMAILDPFVEFYRALPPLAYNTMIVLWFGIGDESKIILLLLSAFPPIFIQTVFGVQRIPRDRINGARSLGTSPLSLFFEVIFPSALPDILTGLRTAVGVAYATLVAAEMVASASGIGWMVLDASKYIMYSTVYFGIIIMGTIAIVIDMVLKILIKTAAPWQEWE